VDQLGSGYTTIAPVATITSPTNNQVVSGLVNIIGTGSTTKPVQNGKDNTFQSYTLEWGAGWNPTSWTQFGSSTQRVENGVLGTWDTTGKSGCYTIRLTAKDWANHVAAASVVVGVASSCPLLVSIDPQRADICPGDNVMFTGYASGGTGIYSYSWNFGDGTTGSGKTVDHIFYSSATVTLTVLDSGGRSGSGTATVHLIPPKYCG